MKNVYLTLIILLYFFNVQAQTTYTFIGNGNWSIATNWSNNIIPPSILTAGNAIIIDPVSYGECVLDVEQTILYGASFTVAAGKNFRMPYNFVINRPPNASDTISVITRMEDNYGTKINFTYDTINKRYSNWYSYYRSYNFDTTYIYYKDNGKIWYLKNRTYTSTAITVFEYDSAGMLSKIYAKRDMSTDTSNPYYINAYDSLVYNEKKQIASSYTIYADGIGGYYNFYYDENNDSLLKKLKYYSLSATGQFILNDTIEYSSYDNRPNPFNRYFSNFGGRANGFFPLPRYMIQGPGNAFSILSANNCTRAKNLPINYTYNADLVPVKCYIGSLATGDWNTFYYKKVHK